MTKTFADNGILVCTVKDTDDQDGLGYVQVQFPQFVDTPSTWIPVATMMAGPGCGTWFRPKAGDQVLVCFERGDPKFPIVIGSLWNTQDMPPPDDGNPGQNNWQMIVSRSGALLRFDDTPGQEKVEMIDSSGNLSAVLDTASSTITIDARSGHVALKAAATLSIQAESIEITATNGINIDGGLNVTVAGATIDLN